MNLFTLYDDPPQEAMGVEDKRKKRIKKVERKTEVPSLAEYDSHKVFLNKDYLHALLINDMDFMMKSKSFQRKYMQKLPKLLWTFERDLNPGDFALIFLNPDKGDYANNFITSEMAIKNFDRLTETAFDYYLKEKFLKLLRQAYTKAFLNLPDYDPSKRDQDDSNEPRKSQRPEAEVLMQDPNQLGSNVHQDRLENLKDIFVAGRFEALAPNGQIAHMNEKEAIDDVYEEEPMRIQAPKSQEEAVGNGKHGGSDRKVTFKLDEKNPLLTSNANFYEKPANHQNNKVNALETNHDLPEQILSHKEIGEKDGIQTEKMQAQFLTRQAPPKFKDQLNEAHKLPGSQNKKPAPTVTFEDQPPKTKLEAEKEKKKKEADIKKVLAGKKFLVENSKGVWERKSTEVKDYMTLLRQTVYVLLAYQGIVIREFVSSDGQFIIAVCFSHEDNLKKIAESMGLRKEIDLSMVDLLSLEPVDYKFRPLRMNNSLWDSNKWDSLYGKTPENDELHYEINRLVGKFSQMFEPDTKDAGNKQDDQALYFAKEDGIKFHKLPKRCKGILDKIEHMKEEYVNDIIEHAEVPIEKWHAYKRFLEILHERIKLIDAKHATIKEALRKKYITFKVEANVDKNANVNEAAKSIVPDKFMLASNIISHQSIVSNVLDQNGDGGEMDKKTLIKVFNRFVSGNRSTYRLKLYKLSKQLGEAYAVS